jgi:PLP dependent protein
MDEEVGARLAQVRRRVADAATTAGRDPADVQVLLASKTMPVHAVAAALVADDERDPRLARVLLGENRVQELTAKAPELASLSPTWHVIGPLQSNKVNAALRWASCVQSVASLDLARRLAERSTALDVMVQVNVSGEETKHGVAPAAAVDLALDVAQIDGLRLAGLMTIGANSIDTGLVRAGFALLRTLRDEVAATVPTATGLSMGMSRDLEIAVDEGATIVRIGSAVFGNR